MSVSPHIVVQPTRTYAPQGGEVRTAGTMPVAAPATGEDGGFLGFMRGFLDIINPLQHIPVVGAIYRKLTGDEISPMARIAGGTLFGGPLGGGLAVADCMFEQASGATVGDTLVSAAFDDAPPAATTATAVARATTHNPADIRWDDVPNAMLAMRAPPSASAKTEVSLSTIPAPDRVWTASSAPAKPTGPDTLTARQAPAENAGQTGRYHGGPSSVARLTTHATVDAALSLPDAPADPRIGLPPELMAMKMQEALDKYAAMKSQGL